MSLELLFIDHLEPRTLLAAGVVDTGYAPAFNNARADNTFTQALGMQADGRSIHYAQLKKKNTLWREKPDGSLDKSFGSGGKVILPDLPQDLAIGPDGKIVVLYYHFAKKHVHLARFNANGKPDRTFGRRGDLNLQLHSKFYDPQLTVQPDGKIVIGGDAARYNSSAAVYRINTNGTLDNSFGNHGESTLDSQGGDYIDDIAIRRTDNRIVAVGGDDGDGNLAVWIFAPNGALEWTGSLPQLDPLMFASHGDSLVIAGDGSIVVSGDYVTHASSDPNDHDTIAWGIVARFPGPNSSKPLLHTQLSAGALALQPDGKVIAAGSNEIWRLNYDLLLDQSFGTAGKSDIDFHPRSAAVAPDGKILIDGAKGTQLDILQQARLSGDTPTASLSKTNLVISGTSGNDDIHVYKSGGMIGVFNNGAGPWFFSASKAKTLQIDASDGNDSITLAPSVPIAAINGGNGDDTLIGKRSKDKISSIEHVPLR